MTSRSDQELRRDALVFYEDDMEALDSILDAFLKKSAAKCALLVDQDGHMITARGTTKNVDLDTISALVAGSFAATKQLAHQFGEKEFSALFHQGKGGNIQLSLVGDRALMTSLFDDNTTVGMVRLYASEAAKRLTSIFRRKEEEDTRPAEASATAGDDEQEGDFLPEGRGALDDLFGAD
jgi:predicted regulator of Ras-like GTPase activity (Roadblock/LC7/MglB family)